MCYRPKHSTTESTQELWSWEHPNCKIHLCECVVPGSVQVSNSGWRRAILFIQGLSNDSNVRTVTVQVSAITISTMYGRWWNWVYATHEILFWFVIVRVYINVCCIALLAHRIYRPFQCELLSRYIAYVVFNAISGKSPGESLEREFTVAICCFIDKTKSLSFFSSLPHWGNRWKMSKQIIASLVFSKPRVVSSGREMKNIYLDWQTKTKHNGKFREMTTTPK